MNKLIILGMALILSGCSTLPESEYNAGTVADGNSENSSQSVSAEIIKDSGLAEQSGSNGAFESEELELALRNLLSRLVRSSSEVEQERGGWEEGVYVVREGDTLSDIVHEAVKGTEIHPDFILNAIVKVNPSAFVRGNPSWMLAGKKIKFPRVEDFHRIIFKEAPDSVVPSADSDPYEGWITYP